MGTADDRPLPERYRPGLGRVLLLGTLLVILNLPVLVALGADWRLAAEGIDTTGEVLETQQVGTDSRPLSFVAFRMSDEVDPQGRTWRTEMEPRAYAEAERTGEVSVRVLPGDPASFQVEGARRAREGLWFTLVADAVLLAFAAFAYRYGRRAHEAERQRRQRVELATGRPFRSDAAALRLVATGDLRPAAAGAAHTWQRTTGDTVELCGELVAIRDADVELRVGDRRVVLDLAEHRNHARFREPARVTARLS